uniref:(northern house mosquito) hypothetical protein n=1 Tax=Culex pipiens TaxID=7175 RepID=A0A8D8CT58_CULPI
MLMVLGLTANSSAVEATAVVIPHSVISGIFSLSFCSALAPFFSTSTPCIHFRAVIDWKPIVARITPTMNTFISKSFIPLFSKKSLKLRNTETPFPANGRITSDPSSTPS